MQDVPNSIGSNILAKDTRKDEDGAGLELPTFKTLDNLL